MTAFELAALIGAFAWLPHVIGFFRAIFTKAEIGIIAEKNAEIGFTTFGPIINMRVAFYTKNKDIVVSNIRMRVTHESGDSRLFSWFGVKQQMLQMNTRDTGPIPFEKELSVLAIKLSPKDIEERSIRFQDSKYHEEKGEFEAKAVKKLNYLQSIGQANIVDFLKCEEMSDLKSYITRSFGWKPGVYTLVFELESPEAFSITNNSYRFALSAIDVENLEKNRLVVDRFFESQLLPVEEGKQQEPIVWNWRYPAVKATT